MVMHMEMENQTKYPDEIIDCLIDEKVFLLAVEQTITLADQLNCDDSDRAMAVLAHLAMLCYIQGMCKTVDELTSTGKLKDASITPSERELMVVRNGQSRWEFAKLYCKDTLNVDLHPLGMLVVLKRLAIDDESGSKNEALSDAVDTVAAELESIAKKELEEVQARTSETLQAVHVKNPSLIPEFFRSLEDIGTFNFDRSKYDNDSDRAKHDRIMELYNGIVSSE